MQRVHVTARRVAAAETWFKVCRETQAAEGQQDWRQMLNRSVAFAGYGIQDDKCRRSG